MDKSLVSCVFLTQGVDFVKKCQSAFSCRTTVCPMQCIALDRIQIHYKFNINSEYKFTLACPSIRPVSIHPATTATIVSSVLERSSPNLEQLPLNILNKIFLSSPWNGHVTKLVIWYSLIISGTVKYTAFKFYAELMMEEYNKTYTQDSP